MSFRVICSNSHCVSVDGLLPALSLLLLLKKCCLPPVSPNSFYYSSKRPRIRRQLAFQPRGTKNIPPVLMIMSWEAFLMQQTSRFFLFFYKKGWLPCSNMYDIWFFSLNHPSIPAEVQETSSLPASAFCLLTNIKI